MQPPAPSLASMNSCLPEHGRVHAVGGTISLKDSDIESTGLLDSFAGTMTVSPAGDPSAQLAITESLPPMPPHIATVADPVDGAVQ